MRQKAFKLATVIAMLMISFTITLAATPPFQIELTFLGTGGLSDLDMIEAEDLYGGRIPDSYFQSNAQFDIQLTSVQFYDDYSGQITQGGDYAFSLDLLDDDGMIQASNEVVSPNFNLYWDNFQDHQIFYSSHTLHGEPTQIRVRYRGNTIMQHPITSFVCGYQNFCTYENSELMYCPNYCSFPETEIVAVVEDWLNNANDASLILELISRPEP